MELRLEQGHEISRPSLLWVRARDERGARTVELGGRVIPTSRGQLL